MKSTDILVKETAQWSRDFPPLPALAPTDWEKFRIKERRGE